MSESSSLVLESIVGSKCKEIPSLYILKAVCAFCVVMIHVHFFCKDYFMPFCRLAVPLFFMISGYLLPSDRGVISLERIKQTIKKIFWINLTASSVYLIYKILIAILLFIVNHEDILWFKIFFPKHFLLELLLGNPYSGVLWYLVAYMQTLLVFYIFILCNRFDFLLRFFPVFFLGGLLIGCYNFWYPLDITCLYRNFLTMGIPFVLLGVFIRRNFNAIMKGIGKYLLLFCLFSCFCAYVEYFYIYQFGCQEHGDYNLFTIIFSISVFLYFISHQSIGKNTYLEIIGKKYSLFIYLYHLLCYNIIDILIYKIFHGGYSYSWSFLVVSILTLVVAVVYYKTKNILLGVFSNVLKKIR